jgi:hypothetical protein
MGIKVRKHLWVDGILKTIERVHEKLDDALRHAKEKDGHAAKVYDENGQLTHHFQWQDSPDNKKTYA